MDRSTSSQLDSRSDGEENHSEAGSSAAAAAQVNTHTHTHARHSGSTCLCAPLSLTLTRGLRPRWPDPTPTGFTGFRFPGCERGAGAGCDPGPADLRHSVTSHTDCPGETTPLVFFRPKDRFGDRMEMRTISY